MIFDCDGVILESEDLHRRAYNAAFANFSLECNGTPVVWSEEFYDELQNTVGGGKPKMRWYFSPERNGWPVSSILGAAPQTEDEQAKLIDTLQVFVRNMWGSRTVDVHNKCTKSTCLSGHCLRVILPCKLASVYLCRRPLCRYAHHLHLSTANVPSIVQPG